MTQSSELPTGKNSVYKKIHDCMKNLSFIEKDKKNTFHNYKYASEEAIKKAVHEQLVNNGLIFTVTMEECNVTETKTKKGEPTRITNVRVNYCFVDIETGDKMCGTFYGTGEDALDKGTYKALTGAIKYILTSTFLIPTGDDPEKDQDKPENKTQPKSDANEKEKEKEWITEAATKKAAARIEAGEIDLYDKCKSSFRISKANSEILNKALAKGKEVANAA